MLADHGRWYETVSAVPTLHVGIFLTLGPHIKGSVGKLREVMKKGSENYIMWGRVETNGEVFHTE